MGASQICQDLESLLEDRGFAVLLESSPDKRALPSQLVLVRKTMNEEFPYAMLYPDATGYYEITFGSQHIQELNIGQGVMFVDLPVDLRSLHDWTSRLDCSEEQLVKKWSQHFHNVIRAYAETVSYIGGILPFPAGTIQLKDDKALAYLDQFLDKDGFVAVTDLRAQGSNKYALIQKAREDTYQILFFDRDGTMKDKTFIAGDPINNITLHLSDGRLSIFVGAPQIHVNSGQTGEITISSWKESLGNLMKKYHHITYTASK